MAARCIASPEAPVSQRVFASSLENIVSGHPSGCAALLEPDTDKLIASFRALLKPLLESVLSVVGAHCYSSCLNNGL